MIFALTIVLVTQAIALFVQYRTNRNYKGIGYWLLGSSLMALGFILMPLVGSKSLSIMSRIANPLVVLGHICMYIGVKEFLNKKLNKWIPIWIFIAFNLSYYYYIYINNHIYARTCIIAGVIIIISLMVAYEFFFKKDSCISSTANFTASIFSIYACFYMVRIFQIIIYPPGHSYIEQSSMLVVGFVVSIIISNLSTFGFIIMINQRLNKENQIKKEKLELIFNTNLEPQIITRLEDGLVVDVNDEFPILSGYDKEEIMGNFLEESGFWYNPADRKLFIAELKNKGICENMEFIFQRKDKSQFPGIISARIIVICSVPHIISVVRDITERKLTESKMQKLIKQLEIERNTAQYNAITDGLTGLVNRRHFDVTLNKEFHSLKRSGSILSFIMLDIDYFKKYNDTYGHLAGDECLRMIGKTLKEVIGRASDTIARYGGEEFIAILSETDEKGAKVLGEKIRQSIEDLAIPHIESDVSEYVTVSVGIISIYPTNFEIQDQALKLVDEALYYAKEKGRNRCVYGSKGNYEVLG